MQAGPAFPAVGEDVACQCAQPESAAVAEYEAAHIKTRQIADSIRAVNALSAAKKEETGAANRWKADLDRSREGRYAPITSGRPGRRAQSSGVKATFERSAIRTIRAMRPYERRIDHYLDAFNAGFRITETARGYPGGTAASTYGLVIDKTTLDPSEGRTLRLPDGPHSCGDR